MKIAAPILRRNIHLVEWVTRLFIDIFVITCAIKFSKDELLLILVKNEFYNKNREQI